MKPSFLSRLLISANNAINLKLRFILSGLESRCHDKRFESICSDFMHNR